MDIAYFESGYIEDHYTNYQAQISVDLAAFSLFDLNLRVIHLMERLTYKIREETRLYDIRQETRLRTITSETRTFKIKEG